MYLKFLQISSSILLSIFILAFAYRVRDVFNPTNLRRVWKMAAIAGMKRFEFLEKVRGYKSRGWKEFTFRRGKVSVWDESKSMAAKKLATAHISETKAARKKRSDARKAQRNASKRRTKIRNRTISN